MGLESSVSGWKGRAQCGVGSVSGTWPLPATGHHRSRQCDGWWFSVRGHPEVQTSDLHICISYSRSGPECVCVCVSVCSSNMIHLFSSVELPLYSWNTGV